MLKLKRLIGSLLLVFLIAGCAGAGPKQTGGQLLGGAAGALLGSQFGKGSGRLFGVAIGALAGSYLGGSLGHAMDEKDRQMAQSTMLNTLESAPDHQTRSWKNPNNNHAGTVAVTRTQEVKQSNMVCRDYVHTVIIDGQQEKMHGRACRDVRDSKGHWQIEH